MNEYCYIAIFTFYLLTTRLPLHIENIEEGENVIRLNLKLSQLTVNLR